MRSGGGVSEFEEGRSSSETVDGHEIEDEAMLRSPRAAARSSAESVDKFVLAAETMDAVDPLVVNTFGFSTDDDELDIMLCSSSSRATAAAIPNFTARSRSGSSTILEVSLERI